MDIQPGTLLRYRFGFGDLWRVMRVTAESAYLARCDGSGDVGLIAKEWMFRKTTVQRDFFPA